MDYNENKQSSEVGAQNTATNAPTSLARRVIAAILVLIAALLLGYVLYDIILSSPSNTSPVTTGEQVRNAEPSDEEKMRIMEKMEDTDDSTLTEAEMRVELEAMNTDSKSEVSEEERTAIMESMQ